jgi:hypothetical protein
VLNATGSLVPAPLLARQERLGPPEEHLSPGAYHVRSGELPNLVSSTAPSEEQDLEGVEQSNGSARNRRLYGEQTYLVEATLFDEKDPFPPVPAADAWLLVAATPIRRARQVTFVIAPMAVAATIVGVAIGLGLGLTRDRTPPPPATSPSTSVLTSSPAGQVSAWYQLTLSFYTIESLHNICSPQHRSFNG